MITLSTLLINRLTSNRIEPNVGGGLETKKGRFQSLYDWNQLDRYTRLVIDLNAVMRIRINSTRNATKQNRVRVKVGILE
jgi:hypothetical protein